MAAQSLLYLHDAVHSSHTCGAYHLLLYQVRMCRLSQSASLTPCLKLLNISDLSRRKPLRMVALPASISARSFISLHSGMYRAVHPRSLTNASLSLIPFKYPHKYAQLRRGSLTNHKYVYIHCYETQSDMCLEPICIPWTLNSETCTYRL